MIWLLRLASVLVAALVLFVAAALIAALAPQPGRAQSLRPDDPPIYVCASLAHTDIVVPLHDDAFDWPRLFPEIAANAFPDAYLAIGWGDFGVYYSTPRWADLRPTVALNALLGLGPATLHVAAVRLRADQPACRRLRIDREGRRALADFIAATARPDAQGAARVIDQPRPGEAFYAAAGAFAPWRTCNVWASQALHAAGLPAAIFAPFAFGVDWPLRRVAV